MSHLDALVRRPQQRQRQIDGIVDGVVTHAEPGRLWFTVAAFDGGVHEFGGDHGAPYPSAAMHGFDGDPSHSHPPPGPPTAGVTIAAAFVDGDVDQPRVLAVYL